MSEVKSNRAWREECEALRLEVEHWKRRALTPTADQLRQAKMEVLREAAEKIADLTGVANWLRGRADELEAEK